MTEKAQLEKDRKCTHRKMAEKAHIGNIQTSGRNSTIGNIQTRKMTENAQSEISRLGKWQKTHSRKYPDSENAHTVSKTFDP